MKKTVLKTNETNAFIELLLLLLPILLLLTQIS